MPYQSPQSASRSFSVDESQSVRARIVSSRPSLLCHSLECQKNQIKALPDLSHLTSLESLDCSNNPLGSLPDLSRLVRLVKYG